ncbi:MAG TPA: DUF642 domain-containing protein [Rhodopila sp.]|jgi:hypothetical protein|nr:DUF642 domain-containing protein [Rhodopila sp.]
MAIIMVLAMGAAMIARPAPAQNLVINPGFEDSTDGMTSPGWTLGPTFGFTSFENNAGDAHTGNWSITFGDTQNVTLSQDIATVPGTTYLVTFYLTDNNTGAGGKSFLATLDGQTVLSLTNSTATGYQFYSANIVATSTQSTLSFTAENPPGQFNLDDVSVEVEGAPAPVPGTGIVSVLAGVAMLVGTRRMRRTTNR